MTGQTPKSRVSKGDRLSQLLAQADQLRADIRRENVRAKEDAHKHVKDVLFVMLKDKVIGLSHTDLATLKALACERARGSFADLTCAEIGGFCDGLVAQGRQGLKTLAGGDASGTAG